MDMTTYSKVKFGEEESSALYRIVDGVVIVASLILISSIYLGVISKVYLVSGFLSALLFVFFAEQSGLYRYNGVFS